jgi:MinD superfamily P-loop ATPase
VRIAIASGKGGTGKTTLAVNLAALLNDEMPEEQVILVDLDVEEPNSSLFFEQKAVSSEKISRTVPEWDKDKCTLCGQCKEICKFNALAQLPEQILIFPELCHSCFACIDLCPGKALLPIKREIGTLSHFISKELNLIESTLVVGEPSGVPLIAQTKEYLKNNFNEESVFILDCPPGNSCPVIESVRGSDFVVLVTEPTPYGLSDLIIAIKTIQKLEINFGVIINKALSNKNLLRKYCLQNDIFILGSIPHEREYAESYSNGELLYSRFPKFKKTLKLIHKNIRYKMNTQ